MKAYRHIHRSVITAAALLIAAPPISHADPSDFYHDVTSIGVTSSDGEEGVIDIGKAICFALERGRTPEEVARQLFYNSAVSNKDKGISLEQARQEVTFAVNDMCPP
ncbi:DUF732 domain-containing protein [Mycobacterium sp.]|uniref:DUF732 domain-containing protein n=1 Tax=Mycobacterium sp. TaxID=1785 RepID=UPI0025CC0E77|nr:DUF732 domain-containing protein [Mycobacterium sp.]